LGTLVVAFSAGSCPLGHGAPAALLITHCFLTDLGKEAVSPLQGRRMIIGR